FIRRDESNRCGNGCVTFDVFMFYISCISFLKSMSTHHIINMYVLIGSTIIRYTASHLKAPKSVLPLRNFREARTSLMGSAYNVIMSVSQYKGLRAVIYARTSPNKEGEELGVQNKSEAYLSHV